MVAAVPFGLPLGGGEMRGYCARWFNSSACTVKLAECLIAEECAFAQYDAEANVAFLEAVHKTAFRRPRLLDFDGSVQICEQCNGPGAVVIGVMSLSVERVWAHNAFDSGVCRPVYICDPCFRKVVSTDDAWFDASMYGLDLNCPACRAEAEMP